MSSKPLTGKRVLITRPKKQSPELADLLISAGAQVLSIPCLEIVPSYNLTELKEALEALEAEDWIFFTSVNGVTAVTEQVKLPQTNIAVIGKKTAQSLEAAGYSPSFIARDAYSEGFAREFSETYGDELAGRRALMLRAEIGSDAIPRHLEAIGMEVNRFFVYKSCRPHYSEGELNEFSSKLSDIDLIVFASSETVRNFVFYFGAGKVRAPVAAIGHKTADTAESFGFEVLTVPPEATMESLVAALCEALTK